MILGILQAIAAIPKLIAAIEGLIAYFKKAEEEKWFQQSATTFQALADAKTSEEKSHAAQAIQDLIRTE